MYVCAYCPENLLTGEMALDKVLTVRARGPEVGYSAPTYKLSIESQLPGGGKLRQENSPVLAG